MLRRSQSLASVLAAAAVAGLSNAAFGAYTLTPIITLPYQGTSDATSTGNLISYTSLTVSASTPSMGLANEHGVYIDTAAEATGTVSGTNTGVGTGTGSAQTAFAYSPTTGFQLIGVYNANAAGTHFATLRGINSAGQVIGYSSNQAADSTANNTFGNLAWAYTPGVTAGSGTSVTLTGLSGPNLSYTPTYTSTSGSKTAGTFSSVLPDYVNTGGQILGNQTRYQGDTSTTPSSNSLGQSVFLYASPTSAATEIGLFGTGYSRTATITLTAAAAAAAGATTATARQSNNTDVGLNANGQAAGFATAYDPTSGYTNGIDGWLMSGGNTTAFGLYQSGQVPTTTSYLGSNTYSYSTASTGVTNYRSTTPGVLNASGQVAGYSLIFASTTSSTSQGQTAFVYTPNAANTGGAYTTVGLTANGFTAGTTPAQFTSSFVSGTGSRSSTINFMNSSGQTAGISTEYFATGTVSGTPATPGAFGGQAAFYANAAGTTTQIGLYSDAVHIISTRGVTSAALNAMNESGMVAGAQMRYISGGSSTQGQDAFVYDPNANGGTTFAVDPTDETTSGYAFSQITYLSDDGDAVGYYRTTSSGAFSAFVWSESIGFAPLNQEVSPSLSTAGYSALLQAYFDGTGGTPIYTTATTTAGATSFVSLTGTPTAVPEPASAALVVVAGVGLIGRRRRRPAEPPPDSPVVCRRPASGNRRRPAAFQAYTSVGKPRQLTYARSVFDLIGGTPVMELDRIRRRLGLDGRLLAKLEHLDPGGSKKDRVALSMVRAARADGRLAEGRAVVGVTSGNTGTGLAIVCAALGHRFHAVMSDGNTRERAQMMRALGAEVVLVPQLPDGTPGQVNGRDLRVVKGRAAELMRQHGAFFVDQFENPAAHKGRPVPSCGTSAAASRARSWPSSSLAGGCCSDAGHAIQGRGYGRGKLFPLDGVTIDAHLCCSDADASAASADRGAADGLLDRGAAARRGRAVAGARAGRHRRVPGLRRGDEVPVDGAVRLN